MDTCSHTTTDIYDVFEGMRHELSPIIDSWNEKLDIIWNHIQQNKNQNMHLSYLVEYNTFRDIITLLEYIKNNSEDIDRNSQAISQIRQTLLNKDEYENIGDDIVKYVLDIKTRIDQKQIKTFRIGSKLKRAINMVKIGEHVIPHKTKEEIIDVLNECIVKWNQKAMFPSHGIIIHLTENTHHHKEVIYHAQCQQCQFIMQCSGSSDLDIYAPIKCPKCSSFNLKKYSYPFENIIKPIHIEKKNFCNIQ